MKTISENKAFGGIQGVYEHASGTCRCPMRFGVYRPPQAEHGAVPVLHWLSGLTCTEQNFVTKAGAQRMASALGLMIVAPDTSPRGDDVPDAPDRAYDLGLGAGFYIDAIQEPWARHYRMETYVAQELQAVLREHFPADLARQGIAGHSMGGHGALTLGLKYQDLFSSISAFSPICAPAKVPWGRKAFSHYLGTDETVWKEHDASHLMAAAEDRSNAPPILVDQGTDDEFLDRELKPELFEAACETRSQKLTLRRHRGYDHSYYFIASFIDDHIRHHHEILTA